MSINRGDAFLVRFRPLEPEPAEVRVCYSGKGARTVTAIYRRWPEGTTGPDGACRRCSECLAYGDACLMTIPAFIAREDAPGYSNVASGRSLQPT